MAIPTVTREAQAMPVAATREKAAAALLLVGFGEDAFGEGAFGEGDTVTVGAIAVTRTRQGAPVSATREKE